MSKHKEPNGGFFASRIADSMVERMARGPVYYGWYMVAVVFTITMVRVGFNGHFFGIFLKPMSQEFQWTGTSLDERLSWQGSLFYLHEETDSLTDFSVKLAGTSKILIDQLAETAAARQQRRSPSKHPLTLSTELIRTVREMIGILRNIGDAQGIALQQHWAGRLSHFFDDLQHLQVDGNGVVAVYLETLDAVTRGAIDQVFAAVLLRVGRRIGELINFDDDQQRNVEDTRIVDSFMKIPGAGGAVPDIGHGDGVEALASSNHDAADGDRNHGAEM